MSVLARRLEGRRVIVCAGTGGVGKTTLAAAIAIGLADRGLRVAVVTIDPARRLAEAMGLEELTNRPRRVERERWSPGRETTGELWAMMLDVRRTFDEVIARVARSDAERDRILGNRLYRQLSGAVAGSQEYTAVAKLDELHREGGFDAIVLDTPPSRDALAFLDAPDRLLAFLDGSAMRLVAAPGGVARAAGAGAGLVLSGLRGITGIALLEDLSELFAALGGVTGGLRERAAGVKALLADPATTFVVVASPEPAAVEETIFLAARLREAGLPYGALVVNRVHPLDPGAVDETAVAARLAGRLGPDLARRIARTHAELQVLARRDAAAVERLRAALGEPEPVLVDDLAADAGDAAALLEVRRRAFAQAG